MADATATQLAAEAEKAAQEALKRQKAEEDALLKAYGTNAQGLYDTAKGSSEGLLSGAKTDIQGLYDQGYTDLQNLVGQESEAAIKQSLRPIEGQLAQQGLLGGPSGALNEALAGAAERVRNEGIGRLADYQGQRAGALANVYGSTATQKSALEQAYAGQSQDILATALGQGLQTAGQGTDIAEKFGLTGLEAALGSNKMVLEQAGQKDLLAEQAALKAEADAAQTNTAAQELKTRQTAWDRQYSTLLNQYYAGFRQQGYQDAAATAMARQQAATQMGPRPA